MRNRLLSLVPLSTAFLLGLIALATARPADAITIDCATADCIGGVYTLDVVETAPNLYTATFTVDTTGVYDVGATLLNDVEFKVANDYINPVITSGPTGAVVAGPLNGRGCSGNNDSFICVNLTPDLALGQVYTWQITFGATALVDEWHIGARYTAPNHRTGWVISESGTPIPEPSAALVFGAGLLVASQVVRQRR